MNKQALLVIAALKSFYCNSILLGSNSPKHPYHGRLMFKGIQPLLLCQRKQIIFQRCSVCCALSEEDTAHSWSEYLLKLTDLNLFWFLHEPVQGREKVRWKIGRRERQSYFFCTQPYWWLSVLCWEKTVGDHSTSLQKFWIHSKYKTRFLFYHIPLLW